MFKVGDYVVFNPKGYITGNLSKYIGKSAKVIDALKHDNLGFDIKFMCDGFELFVLDPIDFTKIEAKNGSDMSKFKEGDEVTIKATVKKLSPEAIVDGLVTIEIEGGYVENCHPLTINQTSVVDHKPRPLQVGDEVYYEGLAMSAKIVAIDGIFAWVKYRTGAPSTVNLKYLTRI